MISLLLVLQSMSAGLNAQAELWPSDNFRQNIGPQYQHQAGFTAWGRGELAVLFVEPYASFKLYLCDDSLIPSSFLNAEANCAFEKNHGAHMGLTLPYCDVGVRIGRRAIDKFRFARRWGRGIESIGQDPQPTIGYHAHWAPFFGCDITPANIYVYVRRNVETSLPGRTLIAPDWVAEGAYHWDNIDFQLRLEFGGERGDAFGPAIDGRVLRWIGDFGLGVAGGLIASPDWNDHLARVAAVFLYGGKGRVWGYY